MTSAAYNPNAYRSIAKLAAWQAAGINSLGVTQVQTQKPLLPIGNFNTEQNIGTTFTDDTLTPGTETPNEPLHDIPLDTNDSIPFTVQEDGTYVFATIWTQALYTYSGTNFASGLAYMGWSIRTNRLDPATSVLDFPNLLIFDSRNAGWIQANTDTVWQLFAGLYWVVPVVRGLQGVFSNRVISATVYLLGHY